MGELRFEWDEGNARANVRKHGIDFFEASTAFEDPNWLEIPDPEHSRGEERFVLIGRTALGRLVVVVHLERDEMCA